LPSYDRLLTSLRLELAYFSGLARLREPAGRGSGVIMRFERVRPRQNRGFQPLKSGEITPEFLDRTIGALKRWKFDIISIDEVCHRAVTLALPRRFVCLTFDGGYKDLITSAYPVLSKHRVPFTAYVPTAFPDGLGEAWWLALEQVIARETRISLVMDRKEQRFDISTASEKYQLYGFLEGWMRSLTPSDLAFAIRDLCTRYSVDLAALSPLGLADVVGALDMGGNVAALGRSAGVQHGSSGDRTSGMPSVYEPRAALDDPCGSL